MKQVVDKIGIRGLLLLMLTFVFCGKAMAEDFAEGGLYYSTLTDNTVKVVKPTSGKYSGDITIPATVKHNDKTYQVTAIGDNAFQQSGVTSVTLPLTGITSIGAFAFNDCTGLTEFTLPASITSIGERAFYYCDNLKHLYVHSTDPARYHPGSMAFSKIHYGSHVCTLHVPTGRTDVYAADETFKVFTQVEEFDPPKVYELSIAGTQVTSLNASDILGDGIAIYDASTMTLTIKKDITAPDAKTSCIKSNINDLTINVASASTLSATNYALDVMGSTTITGSSQLTVSISSNDNNAIAVYAHSNLTISEANLSVVGPLYCTNDLNITNSTLSVSDVIYGQGALSITNSNVTATSPSVYAAILGWKSVTLTDCYYKVPLGGKYNPSTKYLIDAENNVATSVEICPGQGPTLYDLYIAGTRVTSENAADILGNGVASYYNGTSTLTIKGNITAPDAETPCIKSGSYSLTINVASASTLSATNYALDVMGSTTITGSSQLTVSISSNDNNAIAVYAHSNLTISDANLSVVGPLYCTNDLNITSSTLSVSDVIYGQGALSITNSNVTATSPSIYSAILGWESVTLTDCYIEKPEGGVYNTSKKQLEDKNGNPAQEVIIKKNKPAYILGDANGDGVVNVTDIVATVNYIMVKPSADFNPLAADVNNDGEVNVTDIVGMVNIIMKGGIQDAREVMSVLRRSGFIF